MSNLKVCSVLAFSGLSATALYAAQPPDKVASDGYLDTAMGTSALLHLVTPAKACVPYAINASGSYMSGCLNTAAGADTLGANTTGFMNTAVGSDTLVSNTTGAYNTAVGALAMYNSTTGVGNSAFGVGTLFFNSGFLNTAAGTYALFNNTVGANNTATGSLALRSNTTGAYNTALGSYSLYKNTSGSNLTAIGYQALYSNTTGINNIALGFTALYANTTGHGNVGLGSYTLMKNTAGIRNVGLGNLALGYLTAGAYNIGIGYGAGEGLTTGSNNVDIANQGKSTDGTAANSGVIRIGTEGTQRSTYIAGIYNSGVAGGVPVYVTSTGQFGYSASSERYKTDIVPLGANTERLLQLRPVSFHVKIDPTDTVQYGLIAEEVAKVYPELVIRDRNGRIDGVRYDELAPMLLNELQREHAQLTARIDSQSAEIIGLERQVAMVHELQRQLTEVQAALTALQSD